MKKIVKGIGLGVVALISVILLVATVLIFKFSFLIEGLVVGPDVDTTEEAIQSDLDKGQALADEIQAEGIVLLQNNDKALPLAKDIKKVNVFGWASSQWLGSGSGSAMVKEVNTDLIKALNDYGVETNKDLTKMYGEFFGKRPYEALSSYDHESYRLYEPELNDYSADLLAGAEDFSDTALMVIGRFAGESSDAPKEQYKLTKKDGDIVTDDSRTYLDLSVEEEELLAYLGETYENVVVVVNSNNTINLSLAETLPGVDSVVLVGTTGTAAAKSIPEVLYGDVSPSGRTADTYAYDFATNASYANSGLNGVGAYEGAEGLYPADGETINGNVGNARKELYEQVSFLDYVEGIYIGYRWYETADEEGYWQAVKNEHGEGYDGVVQYPFGYGLSYSEFKTEVMETSPKRETELKADEVITVKVKVTNTGEVAAKEVVQLYYNPPYKTGEIEKASTNLAAFGKTEMLEPGASEEIELSFDVRDMASYDTYDANKNDFVGYELDAGTYEIAVKKNAHELIADKGATVTYKIAETLQYNTDAHTGREISNKFTGEDAVDGVSIDGSDSDGNITFLTRSDFAGTFPTENTKTRVMTKNLKDLNLYQTPKDTPLDEKDLPKAPSDKKDYTVFADGKATELGLALGENYNDERWDDVLNAMSKAEMEKLVLHGYTHTEKVASIGKPQLTDLDGPAQMGGFAFIGTGNGYPNATTIAQTWNNELAYNFGHRVGIEASNIGVSGWYAPGVNIHRSPFGGRNYEYYSEDALLSGVMAAETIQGAKNTGVYSYLKHMALYEQDSNRDSIYTWLDEQAFREIYLKPFQYAVQEGEASGLMSAYGRVGAVWAGGSKGLLTSVLRDEWGFEGSVITDYSDHHVFMNMDQALRAGGDLWMDGALSNGKFVGETNSEEFYVALRNGSKNILFTWLNAEYTNTEYNKTANEPMERPALSRPFPFWKVIAALIAVIVVGGWVFYISRRVKKKKEVKK